MKSSAKFPLKVHQPAVPMFAVCSGDLHSQWAAIDSLAARIGCTPQALLTCVCQRERDRSPRFHSIGSKASNGEPWWHFARSVFISDVRKMRDSPPPRRVHIAANAGDAVTIRLLACLGLSQPIEAQMDNYRAGSE